MSAPSTSVVVCTYNRIQWLTKCLRSLEAQDPRPDEIIVVDGPSTDGTRDMLELLASKGDLKLVRQKKLDGISSARNMGLAEATGDIVCFIDDDAIAQPGWLANVISGYTDPLVGGVGGPVCFSDGSPAMGRNAVSPEGLWFDESRRESIDGLYPVMVGCNMSFRRVPLQEMGGFDPYFRFHQDETDACLGMLFRGYRIGYSEGAVVWHEWCEGSYRQDRIRWYIKLRYLWGRNNSYLVRKHFGDKVPFTKYAGNRMTGFLQKRVPRGILEKETTGGHEASGGSVAMPKFFVLVGGVSEVFGLIKGWTDSGHVSPRAPGGAASHRLVGPDQHFRYRRRGLRK